MFVSVCGRVCVCGKYVCVKYMHVFSSTYILIRRMHRISACLSVTDLPGVLNVKSVDSFGRNLVATSLWKHFFTGLPSNLW